jgi:hypothetical protein
MIKNHLRDLIDIRLIIILAILIAITVVLTMIFSDKVKDFAQKHKRKFYIYALSFVFIYALVAFLGFNKLFSKLSDEYLFYQIATVLFGCLHVFFYRWYFNQFDTKKFETELLFALVITLYSSIPFILIYTALSGLEYTLLMCSQFISFFIPTWINGLFDHIIQIPPKIYVTWKFPEEENAYPELEDTEIRDLLLITLLIKKNENDKEYTSIRAKGPVRMDFGRLFYHTTSDYNKRYAKDPIQLAIGDQQHSHWVFFLQPKWNEKAKYIDARYTLGMNGITENSVIICQRQTKQFKQNKEGEIFDNTKHLQNHKKSVKETEETSLIQ